MGKVAYMHAQICPECSASIVYLKPIGKRTLDAARCVLAGFDTAAAVAWHLKIKATQASDLLRRAQRAQLIKFAHREPRKTGGYTYHYVASQRLRAYIPTEYMLAQRRVS